MNRTPYCRILLPILLLGWIALPARAWYIGKDEFTVVTFHNGELSHSNLAADCNDVNLTATEIVPNSGQRPLISAEITNRNCREGKDYTTYHHTPAGEKIAHKVNRPEWGIVWGYRNAENHHALLLRTGESDPQGFDPPTLQYCIFTVANGDTLLHQPWSNTPNSYLNPEADYNQLFIRPVDGGFEIFIGEEREYRLGFCADDRLFGDEAGIYIGSGANVAMRNWKVTAQKYVERTPYLTEEQIKTHLSMSTNPYEGIYEIVLATSSSTNIRLGGEYRVAFIQDNNEYKLLYLNGAQRAADLWEPGMVKAILHQIDGGEVFRVTWYDANHNPISENIKATISPQEIEFIFMTSISKLIFIKTSPSLPQQRQKSEGNFHLL